MLHRLALRVLPPLTLAVTSDEVRKRKRVIMLVPGLVAFGIYRGVKLWNPVTEPLVLLTLSGLCAAATSLWAYRAGRQRRLYELWRQDGSHRLGWIIGWIGFAYGVQLSLMVLALLKLVHYDFFEHPDGPALMALMIACTSVARDAFEIGHIRKLQVAGELVLTFPDGAAFRTLWREATGRLLLWALPIALVVAAVSSSLTLLGDIGRWPVVQLISVSLVAGALAVWAYLAGEQRAGIWYALPGTISQIEFVRFWCWPGLTFAATYYLVALGIWNYVVRAELPAVILHAAMAAIVAGMMALYCYYLGYRRHLENQVQQMVSPSLLRCPFVMGILSKSGTTGSETVPSASQTGRSPT